ncbi:hemagglutinin [Histophilus somni]|uniref:YadA family autotransporter adhesin n=1 Tax=Histophilus somni TaxID=731 RepID=UPI00109D5862|nr:YadA-like family protein [Histophilus somni]THA22280.1 hemagglutinin [Histophilus somni]
MKIFYLSLTAVVVLTAHSAMAQAQQSNSSNIDVSNGHVYIGKVSEKVTGLNSGTEDKAVAVGDKTKVGESAVAVGFEADAGKEGATAVGRGTKTQAYAVAMGFQANAGVQAISIGKDSKGTGTLSVALGDEAKATHNYTLAFGNKASASGNSSQAFGYLSSSTAEYATAIGTATKATAIRTVAVGVGAEATGTRSVSIGNYTKSNGNSSVSIGDRTNNNANESVAVGYNNTIDRNSQKTVAVGNNIQTTAANSVFLGDSSAYVEKGETTGGIGKVDGNYAGADAKGIVSVGSKGNERRIQNVAAGLLSHRSTDAVNGSQLHATNQRVEEVNKDAKAGIAASMAFKDVPFVPGKWSYAAGAAHYSSESAVSLNLGRTSANGKYAISGGVSSDSRGRVGFRVGISGVFN